MARRDPWPRLRVALLISYAAALLACGPPACADWAAAHADAQHSGFVAADLAPPFHLRWVCHFKQERLGSAMEPIVAGGRLFVATHNGSVYALDARAGKPVWRFETGEAFLQSPAFADGLVLAACTDGNVYVLRADSGQLAWSAALGRGGAAASPLIADGAVFVASRPGIFFAFELATGRPLWRRDLHAPVRQTAAFAGGRVFVTSEDLRLHCFDAANGNETWTSPQLIGQSARDSYPVLAKAGDRWTVIVRTNPIDSFGHHIAADRQLLVDNAGIDGRSWQTIDAWTKNPKFIGDQRLWDQEQATIERYLKAHPEARTWFAFDARTGEPLPSPPVLWCGGCQGVPPMPALTAEGKLVVEYRTAYSNWNLGVAPLVGLGLLDLTTNRITPLHHTSGMQPPWNTFWGTADEQQNFQVLGGTLLLIHQATLGGLDLRTGRLFPIHGERDSWGGFRNLPWARNEWNGPGRGGVAYDGGRLYCFTGSRIECITTHEDGASGTDVEIDGATVPAHKPAPTPPASRDEIARLLGDAVQQVLSKTWTPLYVEPGLAGRQFFFDSSRDYFDALSLAYPHLPRDLQQRVRAFLEDQWRQHPPFGKSSQYSLLQGERREWFAVPKDLLSRVGADAPPHPFGNLSAVVRWADRCNEWPLVKASRQPIRECFEDFRKSNWKLDRASGDLNANRHLASLLAYVRIAQRAGDAQDARTAKMMADQTADALVQWWNRAGSSSVPRVTANVSEVDRFIGNGDDLFFRLTPHNAKLALFRDLTPEVGALIKARAAQSVDAVWRNFNELCPTWQRIGEERQVHYGENFVDPPDFNFAAFTALTVLRSASFDELSRNIDLPWCKADLYFIAKLAMTLDADPANHD